MAKGTFDELASVFGKQPDHVWSEGKLAVGGYKAYGGKQTFLATSGTSRSAGFELALRIDERFNVKTHGAIAEQLLAIVAAHGKALAKGRAKQDRWTVDLPHPMDPDANLELVAGNLTSDVKGLEIVSIEPVSAKPKPKPKPVDPKALAKSLGIAASPALNAIWKLAPGTAFEEYDALDAATSAERARSLRELVASKSFKAKTRSREYFDDDGRVQPVHFDRGWIPFAADGGGNLLCLDTNPGKQGRANQIIQWELRGGGAFVRAPSFAAFKKSLG